MGRGSEADANPAKAVKVTLHEESVAPTTTLVDEKRHPDLERFSDESKLCYAKANQIASNESATFINSIHLIQAILQTSLHQSIDPDGKLQAAIKRYGSIEQTTHNEGLKRALEYSIEYAQTIGCKEITPLILLHGISQMTETQGSQLLQSNGITSVELEALILIG